MRRHSVGCPGFATLIGCMSARLIICRISGLQGSGIILKPMDCYSALFGVNIPFLNSLSLNNKMRENRSHLYVV